MSAPAPHRAALALRAGALVLLAGGLAAPAAPARAGTISDYLAACLSPAGSPGQTATLLSTIGWTVGGDVARAVEARAMVIPYLSGRDEQDLRRNAVTYYLEEGLAAAEAEAARSVWLTSPEGDVALISHEEGRILCTLALAEGVLAAEVTAALPEPARGGTDPQMKWQHFALDAPEGITDPRVTLWDSAAREYTTRNPVRRRDVDLILTTEARVE